MAATPNSHAVNLGNVVKLNAHRISPGGGWSIDPTQLITANVPQSRQWVVTILQAKTDNGSTPWVFSEGQNVTGGPNNVPAFPEYSDSLMCDIRFGAGGASSRVAFDYPAAGSTLGLTCDSFDLSVQMRSTMMGLNAPQFTYPTLADIPMVGAFMVHGIPTDSELTWTETATTIGASQEMWYTVKPYARRLRGWVAGSPGSPTVRFVNSAGSAFWKQPLPGAPGGFLDMPVPAGAQYVRFVNGTANMEMYLQWVIELS
jgi:hypothetical protein